MVKPESGFMFTIITGAQFGDEGKGKIVDLLAKDYDIVARFQGGDNAGHTIRVGDEIYKLHLIPSGILLDTRVLIGPGVVLNPIILAEEISMFEQHGIKINADNLGVDAKTSIIMPYHIEMDLLREESRETKIGTTKRGIGYAYIDKVAREEIRMAELVDSERLLAKLEELAPQKEKEIEAMGGDPKIVRDPTLINRYSELGRQFAGYVTDVSREINEALNEGKYVMAEAAQGTHLDVIHGTQKFVTSSSTIAGSACANLGVGPTRVDKVIGIVKAYITRVGDGPLPTELTGELGEKIQKAGGEFGTTTGRSRRCGWFDLPLLKKAIVLNGYTEISLTKLDVLTGIDPIRICVCYNYKRENVDYPPELADDLWDCKPIYEDLPGWENDLTEVKTFEELPKKFQKLCQNVRRTYKSTYQLYFSRASQVTNL
jgi:adenylosuccinate synthase